MPTPAYLITYSVGPSAVTGRLRMLVNGTNRQHLQQGRLPTSKHYTKHDTEHFFAATFGTSATGEVFAAACLEGFAKALQQRLGIIYWLDAATSGGEPGQVSERQLRLLNRLGQIAEKQFLQYFSTIAFETLKDYYRFLCNLQAHQQQPFSFSLHPEYVQTIKQIQEKAFQELLQEQPNASMLLDTEFPAFFTQNRPDPEDI